MTSLDTEEGLRVAGATAGTTNCILCECPPQPPTKSNTTQKPCKRSAEGKVNPGRRRAEKCKIALCSGTWNLFAVT